MRIAVLDPSGNSGKEGNGTTGIAIFEDGNLVEFSSIQVEPNQQVELYWDAIFGAVERADVIVCESYNLFHHKAVQQSGSALMTPQLIGFLRMQAFYEGIKFVFQDPKDKTRFSDDVLTSMGVFTKLNNRYYCQGKLTNLHQRDAIRHGYFYLKYGDRKG